MGGHNREVARHHMPTTQFRRKYAPCDPSAASKVFRRYAGDARTQPVVNEHAVKIRELIAGMQRRDSIVDVGDVGDVGDIGDVGDVYDSKVIAKTAPPGMEEVARPCGQPTDGAESKPDPETHAFAESEEGDVSRRPNRLISRVNRTGPPSPRSAPEEPTAIVVGRPAPGLIGNPSPTPIRFPDPTAISIWSPAIVGLRNPNLAVVGNFSPGAISVEVAGAGVVVVRPAVTRGVVNDVVAEIGRAHV